VVEETLTDTASVSAVARRHDLNTNLVFKWRKQYRETTRAGEADTPALVPIRLTAPMAESQSGRDGSQANDSAGRIDLVLATGHRLTVTGAVDAALVRTILAILT
jgi:transposase